MGVPRSAKNDHFMAPVSQNQRQTVEKARLLNTQSKLSIPRTGYGDFVAILALQLGHFNRSNTKKMDVFQRKLHFQQKTKRMPSTLENYDISYASWNADVN